MALTAPSPPAPIPSFWSATSRVRIRTLVLLRWLAIVGQTVSTMIASSGVNDTFRIYLEAKRDNVDFNLAHIGDDFRTPYTAPFEKTYMRKLFDYGFEKGRAGYPWLKRPPEYSE